MYIIIYIYIGSVVIFCDVLAKDIFFGTVTCQWNARTCANYVYAEKQQTTKQTLHCDTFSPINVCFEWFEIVEDIGFGIHHLSMELEDMSNLCLREKINRRFIVLYCLSSRLASVWVLADCVTGLHRLRRWLQWQRLGFTYPYGLIPMGLYVAVPYYSRGLTGFYVALLCYVYGPFCPFLRTSV